MLDPFYEPSQMHGSGLQIKVIRNTIFDRGFSQTPLQKENKQNLQHPVHKTGTLITKSSCKLSCTPSTELQVTPRKNFASISPISEG